MKDIANNIVGMAAGIDNMGAVFSIVVINMIIVIVFFVLLFFPLVYLIFSFRAISRLTKINIVLGGINAELDKLLKVEIINNEDKDEDKDADKLDKIVNNVSEEK
jgi:hypothetical protein